MKEKHLGTNKNKTKDNYQWIQFYYNYTPPQFILGQWRFTENLSNDSSPKFNDRIKEHTLKSTHPTVQTHNGNDFKRKKNESSGGEGEKKKKKKRTGHFLSETYNLCFLYYWQLA